MKKRKIKLTLHNIDGDLKINIFQKIQYFSFFIIEIFQDKIQKNTPAIESNLSDFFKLYSNNYASLVKKSPSRICCDFNTFLYLKKNFNVNENIKILDVGCGNGISLDLFSKYFDNFSYQGCDKFPGKDWDIKENQNIDLIYSQSVFEHVENDLSGFISLKETFPYAKQIHFLPAPLSFLNYLKHGFRRYSYKSLLDLQNLLNTKIVIQNIGGKMAFGLYFPIFFKINKKKHILNFLKDPSIFENNKDYLTYLLSDSSKSLPLFYSITL